jgi:hypothetical protein
VDKKEKKEVLAIIEVEVEGRPPTQIVQIEHAHLELKIVLQVKKEENQDG